MIKRKTMLKVLAGSFFIQAAWNFEKMQGLGFAAAISPAMDEVHGPEGAARREASKRHLAFFNTHPYMASPILGAAISMEAQGGGKGAGRTTAADFKRMVMGAYGAIGDNFYWRSLRPLAASLGVLSALFLGVWGAVFFLVLFNVFHLSMRWRGLARGCRLGPGVAGYVKSLNLPAWSVRLRYLTSAVLGVVTASAAFMALDGTGGAYGGYVYGAAAAVAAAASLGVSALVGRGVSVTLLLYIALPLLILFGAAVY